MIGEHFPEHAILGEEGDGGGPDTTLTWIVDPLDGTSNYASGIPFACTSVAVKDADGVVAGAIFEPFRGELFTATRGGGAWLAGERLQVKHNDSLDRALVRDRAAVRRPRRRSPPTPGGSRRCTSTPGARAASGRRRCASPTSPPGGSTPSTSATPPTRGTSPPAR